MTGYKATKTGQVMYGKHSHDVEYEYRGHTYDVEYADDWSYCVTSPRIQHESKQAEIDKLIEEEQRPKKPVRYEDTVEYAMNEFFKFLDEA